MDKIIWVIPLNHLGTFVKITPKLTRSTSWRMRKWSTDFLLTSNLGTFSEKQARKLQDAQAEKLRSLQAEKLTN